MTTEALVNQIRDRLKCHVPVRILAGCDYGQPIVDFRWGPRSYMAYARVTGHIHVDELIDGDIEHTLDAQYAMGRINGGKRDEMGTLIEGGK